MNSPAVAASLVCLFVTSVIAVEPAYASRAASGEEVLCRNAAVVIGTVVDARSHDCRLTHAYECGAYFVGVSMRVDEVFPLSADTIHRGGEVHASFHVANGVPMKVGDATIPMNLSRGGTIGFPATGQAITTDEARTQLVGKRLILALTPADQIIRSSGDAEFAAELGEPYYAAAFTLADEAWVRNTWSSQKCSWWRHQ
jgi:hypothetical protein